MTTPCNPNGLRTRLAAIVSLASLASVVLFVVPAGAQSSWLQALSPAQILSFQPHTPGEAAKLPIALAPASVEERRRATPVSALATSALESGSWQEWGPATRAYHRLVLDSRRNRFILIGGDELTDSQHTVWCYEPLTSTWSQISQWPAWADAGSFVGASYDSARDRVLLLSGDNSSNLDGLSLGDSPTWTHLWSGPALWNGDLAGIAIDTRRDQLALLGDWDDIAGRHRLIRIPLAAPSAWTSELVGGGNPPAVRHGDAVYDAVRDEFVVLFDTSRGSSVWRLNAAGAPLWSAFAQVPFFPCGSMRMLALDAAQDRLLVVDDTQAAQAIPLGGGTPLRLDGPLCGGNRNGSALAFDPSRRRIFLFGGTMFTVQMPVFESVTVDSGAIPNYGAPSSWSAGTWRAENPRECGSRYGHSSVIDPASSRLIIFGGSTSNGGAPDLVTSHELGPTAGWTPLGAGSPSVPRIRFLNSSVYDPEHHALLIYGGQAIDGTGDLLGDLWSLSLDPGGQWRLLAAAGTTPLGHRGAAFFFDAPNSRFIVMGGDNLNQYYGDAWELKIGATAAWRPLVVSGSTALPYGVVFPDPARGDAWTVSYLGSIYHLTITQDEIHGETVPVTGPASSNRWIAGFDAVQRRFIGFTTLTYGRANLGEAWTAALGATADWAPLAISGRAPFPRFTNANFDAQGNHLILTGGYDDWETYFGDAYQLNLTQVVAIQVSLTSAETDARGVRLKWNVASAPTVGLTVERSADGVAWTDAGPARWLSSGEVAFDAPALAAGERMAFRLRVASLGEQNVSEPAWVDGPPPTFAGLLLAPLRNPSDGALRVRLSLTPGTPARLRLLDVSGRVLRETLVPATASEWSFGPAPAPGLYFAEVVQGRERRTAKLIANR